VGGDDFQVETRSLIPITRVGRDYVRCWGDSIARETMEEL
jgi:hypothetical protein